MQDEGRMSSETQAKLATAVADLDHYDVSHLQRDDKSCDINHDRQSTVSEREIAKPDTLELQHLVSKTGYRLARDERSSVDNNSHFHW